MQILEKNKTRETLTPSQRVGEVVSVVIMLLVFAFFIDHQTAQTGFFTAQFGTEEKLCVYGPMLFSLVAPVVRVFSGRRNPARPFEAVTNGWMAVAALWLIIVFPFNFAHFADVLPAGIRFLLGWITNDLGKAVLILQLILCPIVAVVILWKYVALRRRMPASLSTPPMV